MPGITTKNINMGIKMEDKELIESITVGNDDEFREEKLTIETDRRVIRIMFSSDQSCCENVGYFLSDCDEIKFIGSELISIKNTDSKLHTKEIKSLGFSKNHPFRGCGGGYVENLFFVTINTSIGDIQFTAYNSHNGHYGHAVTVTQEPIRVDEKIIFQKTI